MIKKLAVIFFLVIISSTVEGNTGTRSYLPVIPRQSNNIDIMGSVIFLQALPGDFYIGLCKVDGPLCEYTHGGGKYGSPRALMPPHGGEFEFEFYRPLNGDDEILEEVQGLGSYGLILEIGNTAYWLYDEKGRIWIDFVGNRIDLGEYIYTIVYSPRDRGIVNERGFEWQN